MKTGTHVPDPTTPEIKKKAIIEIWLYPTQLATQLSSTTWHCAHRSIIKVYFYLNIWFVAACQCSDTTSVYYRYESLSPTFPSLVSKKKYKKEFALTQFTYTRFFFISYYVRLSHSFYFPQIHTPIASTFFFITCSLVISMYLTLKINHSIQNISRLLSLDFLIQTL